MAHRPLPGSNSQALWETSGNAGLWYEKLGGDWLPGWSLKAKKEGGPKLHWIHSVVEDPDKRDEKGRLKRLQVGEARLLSEHVGRQKKLIEARGGQVLALKNRSTFVTGLGEAHPIETGFAWHPSLGVPYLPGSGVKGVLKTWLKTAGPELVELAAELGNAGAVATRADLPSKDEVERLFGGDGVGAIDFLPLLPVAPVQLRADLVNPHHAPYQRGKEDWPADWQNPVPSFFLAVAPSALWQLGIVPRQGFAEAGDIDRVVAWLIQAADWLGFGAKTAVGYGRFARFIEPKPKKGKSER